MDEQPFALTGRREWRQQDDGLELRSFTMLASVSRFDVLEDEKRSVVHVPFDDYPGSLGAESDEQARPFLKLMDPDEFEDIEDSAPP